MRKARIVQQKERAGIPEELDGGGRWKFAYGVDYVGAPVSLTMPVITKPSLSSIGSHPRSRLNERVLADVLARFRAAFAHWDELIAVSFLSPEKKAAYSTVLAERKTRLGF